jgi:hypothetical protein
MATKKPKTVIRDWGVEEFSSLYQAGTFLIKDVKERVGLLMPVDAYVQDPHVAKQNKGVAFGAINVHCEPDLMDGPTSARIAVVDYDADTGKLEKPVKWDAKNRQFVFPLNGELKPITRERCTEFQFHQVNVWAIIQSVLDIYEATWVLGRSAPWAFEGNRLIVVPHAGTMANAFYDRRSKSIQFYYFGAGNQRVYTCLSHDIIAHETGHAILDGLRPGYIEDSSLQTSAFHEFVADLTAIMTSLLNNELRWQVAAEFMKTLSPDPIAASLEIISSLAEEFGRYATGRPYLRSAESPNTTETVKDSVSPYDWSEVLTGTMFDIFKGMVARYLVKDLQSGGKPSTKNALNWAVRRFRRVALQPLDYLPPGDVQFSDYARAVLQADQVVDPVDEDGYRDLMRDCFCKRGIAFPAKGEEQDRIHFYAYDIERVSRSRTDAYHFLNENRRQLCIPAEQDIAVVDLYQTDKTDMGERRLPHEVVLQYGWREDVELNGSDLGPLDGTTASLLCGGTVVFDDRGNVLSWIHKPGNGKQEPDRRRRRRYCDAEREKGEQRRKELVAYIKGRVAEGYVGLVEHGRPGEIDARPPVVASVAADGTLRLQVTPHLRHWAGE